MTDIKTEGAYVYPFTVSGPPQSTVVEPHGDGSVIQRVASFDNVDLTLTVGAWNMDAVAALVGGGRPRSRWQRFVDWLLRRPAPTPWPGMTPSQVQRLIRRPQSASGSDEHPE